MAWLATALVVTSFGQTASSTDYFTRPPTVNLEVPTARGATGKLFEAKLNATVAGVSGERVPLRTLLDQLSQAYEITIVRDRRIDPTHELRIDAAAVPLRELLDQIAANAACGVSFPGSVVYLGPGDSAELLRTIIAIRTQELQKVPPTSEWLNQRRSLAWADLATPRDILKRFAEVWGLEIENLDDVPHDLLPAGQFAEMTATEMLSVLLIQYGLSFQTSGSSPVIKIVPLPADRSALRMEESFTVRGSAAVFADQWQSEYPGIETEPQGARVKVRGTVEQLEAIGNSIGGQKTLTARVPPAAPNQAGLDRRRFTLSATNVPVSAVMEKLKESGITFELAASLEKHTIDWNTPVTLRLNNATAAELFDDLFNPLGLHYEVDGVTVRLSLASK